MGGTIHSQIYTIILITTARETSDSRHHGVKFEAVLKRNEHYDIMVPKSSGGTLNLAPIILRGMGFSYGQYGMYGPFRVAKLKKKYYIGLFLNHIMKQLFGPLEAELSVPA